MLQATMTNSEYLEACKEQGIKEPDILGFYFPNAIPDFRGNFYRKKDEVLEPPRPIGSCCFYCASELYFPRTIEELEKDWGSFKEEEKACFRMNMDYFLAIFPKEDLNAGILIPATETNIEVFGGEFPCFLCDMIFGY